VTDLSYESPWIAPDARVDPSATVGDDAESVATATLFGVPCGVVDTPV
jgi:hypothetical protein